MDARTHLITVADLMEMLSAKDPKDRVVVNSETDRQYAINDLGRDTAYGRVLINFHGDTEDAGEINKLENIITEQRGDIEELEDDVRDLEKDKARLESQVEDLKQQLMETETSLNVVRNDYETLKANCEN